MIANKIAQLDLTILAWPFYTIFSGSEVWTSLMGKLGKEIDSRTPTFITDRHIHFIRMKWRMWNSIRKIIGRWP